MRRLVFHPACRHPLRLSFEQVDLEHELTIDRVDVVERDHRLEEVAVVILHVLSNSHRIAILVLLHIKKISIDSSVIKHTVNKTFIDKYYSDEM